MNSTRSGCGPPGAGSALVGARAADKGYPRRANRRMLAGCGILATVRAKRPA